MQEEISEKKLSCTDVLYMCFFLNPILPTLNIALVAQDGRVADVEHRAMQVVIAECQLHLRCLWVHNT